MPQTAHPDRTSQSLASHWWHDLEPLERRDLRGETVWLALDKVLRSKPIENIGKDSFLELSDLVKGFEPDVVSKVFATPEGYFWSRVAYRLVAAAVGAEAPSSFATRYTSSVKATSAEGALKTHLNRFGILACAIAVVAKEDLELPCSVPTQGPTSLPGTGYTLDTPDESHLIGVHSGHLLLRVKEMPVSIDPQKASHEFGYRCPSIRFGDSGLVRMQPATFNQSGLGAVPKILAAGVDFQRQQVRCVEQALSMIQKYSPAAMPAIESHLRVVSTQRNGSDGPRNSTYSQLPGACVITATNHVLQMAEDIIHEFHHSWLFALEEDQPLVDANSDAPVLDCRFYSPWRIDRRPLYGLIHSSYVFSAAARFWEAVVDDLQAANDESNDYHYACSRLVRLSIQLVDVTQTILRDGTTGLTTICLEMVTALADEATSRCARLKNKNLGPELTEYYLDDDGHPFAREDKRTIGRSHAEHRREADKDSAAA